MFIDAYIFLQLPDCSNSCVKEILKEILNENEAKCPFELIIKSQSNSKSSNSHQKNDVIIMFCGPFTSSL